MFKFIDFIKNHFFEIILGAAVLFLIIYWIICTAKKKKGTWDTKFHYQSFPVGGGRRGVGESKGEAECRYVLETIFNKPFPKRRPRFLFNNETGSNMELDMYNKELRIACEYNGQQHYKYVPYFHRNGQSDFEKQKRRDKLKRSVCHKLGIFLIEIPYTVKLKDIRTEIAKKLRRNGFRV